MGGRPILVSQLQDRPSPPSNSEPSSWGWLLMPVRPSGCHWSIAAFLQHHCHYLSNIFVNSFSARSFHKGFKTLESLSLNIRGKKEQEMTSFWPHDPPGSGHPPSSPKSQPFQFLSVLSPLYPTPASSLFLYSLFFFLVSPLNVLVLSSRDHLYIASTTFCKRHFLVLAMKGKHLTKIFFACYFLQLR